MNIKYINLFSLVLLSSVCSYAGQIFVDTTAADGKITVASEGRDYLAVNSLDYNLDPSVESPFGNKVGATIIYKIGTVFPTENVVLLFSLYNAYISPNIQECWLMFYENNGLDLDNDGIGDASYDLNNDNDKKDAFVLARSVDITKNQILFRFLKFYKGRFHPQSLFYLACRESDEPFLRDMDKHPWEPAAEFDPAYNLVLNLKKSVPIILRDKDTDVCIEATEAYTCCPSTKLKDLTTSKACFMDFKEQFSIDMDPKVSYIDSYPDLNNPQCENSKSGLVKCYLDNSKPLKKFVDEGHGEILNSDSCTDTFTSSGVITIKNNPDNDIEDPIHLSIDGWKGELNVEFYDVNHKYTCDDSKRGYAALDFTNDRVFIDNNGSPNSNSFGDPVNKRGTNDIPLIPGESCKATVNVYESGSPSSNTIIAPQVSGWSDDVYIGVDGDNYLKMIKWGLSLEFNIYDNNNNFVKSYSLSESSDSVLKKLSKMERCYDKDWGGYFLFWKPNGDEAYIPYMINSNKFRIVISNNSCWDAEIYARVWDEKGRVADNVYLGTIKANSVKILYGDKIFSKARGENPELGAKVSPLYSVILTVGVPKRDVEFAAYDNRENKTKMIPVYDLSGEEWTYRNIELDEDPFEN